MSINNTSQWQVIRNILSSVGGRMFISVSRLIIMLIVVRLTGAEMFGAYIVVLSLLFIGEWLMDFGFTDIAVRNISQAPEEKTAYLKAAGIIKCVQSVFAYGLILGVALLLDYPAEIIEALAVGGWAIIFYGFALLYRTDFRLRLSLEKDLSAESIGVLVMIVAVLLISLFSPTLIALVTAYTLSRIIYLILALYFSKRENPFWSQDFQYGVARKLVMQALPLGFAGLIAASYENVAPIILAKLMTMESVAYYAGAMRFIIPVVVVAQAISSVFYTLLASSWSTSKTAFTSIQQNFVELTVIISCIAFCGIYSGAEFLVLIFGSEMQPATEILRWLSLSLLARAITVSMAMPIIICGGQKKTMWLTLLVVIASAAAIYYLVPIYGLYGAVGTYLFVEFFITAIPLIFVSQYMARFQLKWWIILKLNLTSLIAVAVVMTTPLDGSLFGGVVSVFVFLILAFATGGISKSKITDILQSIKHRKTATEAT